MSVISNSFVYESIFSKHHDLIYFYHVTHDQSHNYVIIILKRMWNYLQRWWMGNTGHHFSYMVGVT